MKNQGGRWEGEEPKAKSQKPKGVRGRWGGGREMGRALIAGNKGKVQKALW